MASSVSNAAPSPLVEAPPTPTVTVTAPTQFATVQTHAEDSEESPRPQAGPLPSKRGEIGYVEGVHDRGDTEAEASASTTSLPARHPADRAPTPAAAGSSTPPTAAPRPPSPNGSTRTAGKRSIISFFTPKRIPTYGGLRLTSLALLAFQACLFGATIAGWVLLAKRMQKSQVPSSSPDDDNSSALSQVSSQIFVHVAFGMGCIAELIFVERSVFRLRAERYAHVHPGEILPRTRRTQEPAPGMAFAPWNRPPLPTYAAALAQSGVGTGDVEDNIIAIPPPPAYGNTRGSTLLLAGFVSDALRSQRVRNSAGSAASRASRGSRGLAPATAREPGDRPKSYMSTDPEWEEICDADRALRLEETLAQLEDGEGNAARRS